MGEVCVPFVGPKHAQVFIADMVLELNLSLLVILDSHLCFMSVTFTAKDATVRKRESFVVHYKSIIIFILCEFVT